MREVVAAVAITLVVQSLTSVAMIAPAVLAPVAATDLGVAPQSIGVLASGCYLFAMVSGLVTGPLISRLGAVRVSQLTVILCGGGLALGDAGVLAIVPLAALAIGAGYGMVNPASSHILVRAAPRPMMSLIFSIKQTGVPIGGAIAGALVPPLLLMIGWRHTLLVLGLVIALSAVLLEPAHRHLDRASPGQPLGAVLRRAFTGISAPIRLALSIPALRELCMVSFTYAQLQLIVFTYLVSYLNLGLGYTLVAAGLVYSVAHGAGIVGRVVWGAMADRVLPPRRMLGVLGLISAAGGLGVAAFTPAWPLAAVVATCALYGASVIGWNGVYLAEVARRAPEGQVGTATGGTQFFTFFGALSGPPLFAAVVSLSGGYKWGFTLFAATPLTVGLLLLFRRRGSA